MSRIDSASAHRLQGATTSLAELAKTKPGLAIAATAAQVDELKQHGEQVAAREAAGARYAAEHADPIYAQVVAQGKVVATVYGSGITVTEHNIAGLTLSEQGDGLALAKTRLAELMQAIPGKAIYSDFAAPSMPPSSTLEDAAMPRVSARGLNAMVRDMHWHLARSRMEIDQPGNAPAAHDNGEQ